MSEFWRLVDDEFGDGYGRVLVDNQVLGGLDYRTGTQAMAAGLSPRAVWRALCVEMDVPQDRWLGKEQPIRRGRRAD